MKNIITFLLALILLMFSKAQDASSKYVVSLEGNQASSLNINQSDLKTLTNKQFVPVSEKGSKSIMTEVVRFKMKVPQIPVITIEGNTLTPEIIEIMSKAKKGQTITFFDFEPKNIGLLQPEDGSNYIIQVK